MKERKVRSVKAKPEAKQAKAVKKPEVFEKKEKVVENKIKTHLSPDHLRQIDAALADVAISKAEMAAKDQTVKAIKLEMQLMQHTLVAELNKQQEMSKTYESAKKRAGQIINDMKKLYDVSGEFSYDNESGEIKRD